jgi:hypothetical protein
MALSRPLLLALLGVALLGATVFAVNNARNTAADDPAPTAQQTAEPAAAAQSAPESSASAAPEELLRTGVTADSLESAAFNGSLTFSSGSQRNVIKTSGAFELGGPKQMPKVEFQLSARVQSMNLNATGGFVTTGDRAWFTRGRTGFAVPQEAWSKIVKGRESGAASLEKSESAGWNPSAWVTNVKSQGTERMDGVQVTHISADVNSARMVKELFQSLTEATPLPGAEQRLRQGGLRDGHVEVWVGDDKIMRRASLQMSGPGDGGRRVNAALNFEFSGVNKPQNITGPAKVQRGLPGGTFGQLANGLVTSIASNVGVSADELRLGVPNTNAHVKAERAVADNKKVVIFFENPKGFDDKAVARSVNALDRRTKSVVVLTDDVRNTDRYESLLEDLGVNQAPAIVVIGRSGKASLIEGYIDADSLVQVVADAR